MKKHIIFFIVLIIAFAGLLIFLRGNEDTWIFSGGQWVKHGNPTSISNTYFSSNSKISDRIIKSINDSQKTIDLALYEFTSEELQKNLNSARDRGVKIRIIADRLQASDKDTVIPKLIQDGYEVKLLSGRENKTNRGSMHHKFAIFDGKLLETGSYNWTYSADNLNYENAVFTSSPELISAYQSEFSRLWEEVRP